MKKTIVVFITTFSLVVIDTLGQEKIELNGVATDGYRNRLLGINVMIKGTLLGTVTNICGEFSLPVETDEFTILFHGMSYDDMRVYEVKMKKADLSSDTLVFQLGHWKEYNPDCIKVDKRLKRTVIE